MYLRAVHLACQLVKVEACGGVSRHRRNFPPLAAAGGKAPASLAVHAPSTSASPLRKHDQPGKARDSKQADASQKRADVAESTSPERTDWAKPRTPQAAESRAKTSEGLGQEQTVREKQAGQRDDVDIWAALGRPGQDPAPRYARTASSRDITTRTASSE